MTGFQPRRVLVARLSAVGDVVRTIPAVRAVRRLFPAARLDWLVEDRCASILEGLEAVDNLQVVPRRAWRGLSGVGRTMAFGRFARSLQRERYDLFLDFHGVLKSALLGWLARIPRRVGFPPGLAREGSHLLLTERVSAPPWPISRYRRNMLLPWYWDSGLPLDRGPGLPLQPADDRAGERVVAQAGLAGQPFVMVYPGTSPWGRYKRWPAERFGQVAASLGRELGWPTAVGWGPGEEALAAAVVVASGGAAVALSPTSLRELAAVIARARLLVAGDTGPLHMASLAGTPVVAVFGPSDPILNEPAPFTPARVVTAGLDCAPCRRRSCDHLDCLRTISADRVAQTVRELLFAAALPDPGQPD